MVIPLFDRLSPGFLYFNRPRFRAIKPSSSLPPICSPFRFLPFLLLPLLHHQILEEFGETNFPEYYTINLGSIGSILKRDRLEIVSK